MCTVLSLTRTQELHQAAKSNTELLLWKKLPIIHGFMKQLANISGGRYMIKYIERVNILVNLRTSLKYKHSLTFT